MAFPRETEDQIRRMVLDICQDHIRKVLDGVRELTSMIYDFVTGANLKGTGGHLLRVRRLKDEANEIKRVMLNELAEAGMLMINREDILRLVVQVNEIADYSEGAAFRINYIVDKKLEIEEELRTDLLELANYVLKTVTNLRETILSLTYSRLKAIEMAKRVEAAEYSVDEIYREIEMKIVGSEMDFGTTLLVRDIAQFLEDIADKAEDAIDSARILALSI